MKNIIKEIGHFSCGQETLEFSKISSTEYGVKKANVISVHGGGFSGKERGYYLTEYIANLGFSTLALDFSGHGNSTGKLSKSSLEKRVNEALGLIDTVGISDSITLIGTSMGGHIALELLDKLTVENLILFCPALYSTKAYSVQFDSGFTDIIRKSESYEDSSVLEKLHNYKGRLLIVIGDNDEIIPSKVIDLYWNSAMKVKSKQKVVLKDTPHLIHKCTDKVKLEIKSVVKEFLMN
jgi:esterase/lipase